MTLEELSRAIDPDAWNDGAWVLTRASIEGMHAARQRANEAARRIFTVYTTDENSL